MDYENKTPKMASAGLGALGAAKKDKIKDRQTKLEKEQRLMRKENFFTGGDKEFRKMESDYKKVDPGFKKGKNKKKIIDSTFFKKDPKKSKRIFDEMDQSNREAGRTSRARGGRIGLKDGSKGCGKAKAGKGNAYGKNS